VTSPATLAKALRALIAVGLIAVTRRGGCTRGGQRLPTLYRFTDEQVFEMRPKFIEASKPTDAWKNVTSINHGRALIRDSHQYARTRARDEKEKKCLLQIPNATSTGDEAVGGKTATGAEAWRNGPIQSVNYGLSGSQTKISIRDKDLPHIPTSF